MARKHHQPADLPVRYKGIEALESRRLLSATASTIIHPNLTRLDSATSSVSGLTPQQVQHAYGFDQITLSGGVKGDGSGQTIAIVDAYNDPNIAGDLHTFDSQFELSDPSLKVVNQSGGASLPATDSGWAGEISLDVEWAHAVAPGANILLVEAKSASLGSLISAVDTARKSAGVSLVSMSWGGSEFAGETSLDSHFTTPAGHTGVTFVVSSGDSGSYWGPQWPASSANVLSVGGTSLTLADTSGTYGSETSWSSSTGGTSSVVSEPAYQQNVQSTGARTSPDVSYNADPNNGFAVYDSVPDQGYVGWQVVGGTSAGAPQWAGLIAIANQGRTIAGAGTLDGASGTLPALYQLYNSPSTYSAAFNDIVDPAAPFPTRHSYFFAPPADAATAGYDTVTGLGTPHAPAVVQALQAPAGITASTKNASSISSAARRRIQNPGLSLSTTGNSTQNQAAALAAIQAGSRSGFPSAQNGQQVLVGSLPAIDLTPARIPAAQPIGTPSGAAESDLKLAGGGTTPTPTFAGWVFASAATEIPSAVSGPSAPASDGAPATPSSGAADAGRIAGGVARLAASQIPARLDSAWSTSTKSAVIVVGLATAVAAGWTARQVLSRKSAAPVTKRRWPFADGPRIGE